MPWIASKGMGRGADHNRSTHLRIAKVKPVAIAAVSAALRDSKRSVALRLEFRFTLKI